MHIATANLIRQWCRGSCLPIMYDSDCLHLLIFGREKNLIMFFCSRVMNPASMYQVNVILSPKGAPEKELQLQSRCLESEVCSLAPEGILVKTQAAGVCHTDLHLWHGHYKIGKAETDLLHFTRRSCIHYPIVPGHEIAGLVHAVGSDVSTDSHLAVGDRVGVYPWLGCNECTVCAAGDCNYCSEVKGRELGFSKDGGYSEYVNIPHYRYIFKLPDTIPFSVGALLPCSALTAYTAIKKCTPVAERVQRWEKDLIVAVIGLGGLGQWALRLLPLYFGKDLVVTVVGIDNSPRKLQIVQERNLVDRVFLFSSQDDLEQQASKILEDLQDKPQVVLDFVNCTETFSLSTELLAKTGIHVMVGLHGGLGELRLPLAAISGGTHVGTMAGSLGEMRELVELMCKERVSGPAVKEYKLCEANQALEDLERGLIGGRAILNMESN